MFAPLRRAARRAAVLGSLTLPALLGVATPAHADDWHSYGSYWPLGKCREVGQDLIYQGRADDYKCYKYANKNLYLLRISWPDPKPAPGPRPQ